MNERHHVLSLSPEGTRHRQRQTDYKLISTLILNQLNNGLNGIA